MSKKLKSIIVSILTIIMCTFTLSALFTYLKSINTGNVNLNSPSIEVLDSSNKAINNTLSWLNEDDEVVTTFNSSEKYHLDTLTIKNTSNSDISLEYSLTSSNIDNLDDYLTLKVESSNNTLLPNSSTKIKVYVSIKEDIDNSYQGTSINDLKFNISSKEDITLAS